VWRAGERLRDGGLLCCALDTELLGHWWYEGQAWLGEVLKEAPRHGVELVTVSEGLRRVASVRRPLAASTWGARKDLSTWDAPAVADIVFDARRAELRTVAAIGGARAALERAARELLALQASDWAFLVTRGLAGDYPRRRFEQHLADHDAAVRGSEDMAPALRHLAPDLDLASLTTP
jgi:1,4-alpha-glucan branching enzyme